MKSRLKELAADTAKRTLAAERVALRRWLRREASKTGKPLPDHLYLLFELDELCEYVRASGGDPTAIRAEARKHVISTLLGGA